MLKFECEVCSKVSTAQIFFKANGEIGYGRARQYIKRVNGKPQFEYHPQSIDYLKRKLWELEVDSNNEGHNGQVIINANGDLQNFSSSKTNSSSVWVGLP